MKQSHRADTREQQTAINRFVTDGGAVPDRLLPTPTGRNSFRVPEQGDAILVTLPIRGSKRMKAVVFRVMTVKEQHPWMPSPISRGTTLKMRVEDPAPRGKKWNLRGIDVGTTVFWGSAAFEVGSRTGKSLRIRLMDVYDQDEVEPQGSGEESQ